VSDARTARYYDAIYAARGKDYARESARLHALIQERKQSPGRALLDVACGTGRHLVHLKEYYAVEGLDADPAMLAAARARLRDVPFHQGDMEAFEVGRRFDVVTCLFSAIAYARTPERLARALRAMADHTHAGGLVIVEPFFSPDRWSDGYLGADFVDEPDLKLARMNVSRREGRLAVLDFHFLVATPAGVEHFTERHDLALFTHEEYLAACGAVGLEVSYDPEGLMGRGLYIGLRRP
jgi:SAM-dependent methyltransferase